jgi:BirA family biotin operon repressor/biotin-[acetyl-CoA-carboxylase] ligase
MSPRCRWSGDRAPIRAMNDPDIPILPPGYRLIAREDVGSTNDEARALIAAGAAAGAVVWAESQTAGKGRYGREWVSPPGNLYCSIILRPTIDQARLSEIAFVSALAVRDAVAAHVPQDVAIEFKWPNDVLAAGRKVAGILVETEKLPDEARSALILGIGINISSSPRETSYPATSIAAFARAPRVARLVSGLVAAVDRRVERWLRNGFGGVRDEWMRHAYGVGTQVTDNTGFSGTFTGLDETGAIVIASTDGERRRLVTGSVRYL